MAHSKVPTQHHRKGKKSKVIGRASNKTSQKSQSIKFITGEDDEEDFIRFTRNSLDRFIMESIKDNLNASINGENEIELYWGLTKLK